MELEKKKKNQIRSNRKYGNCLREQVCVPLLHFCSYWSIPTKWGRKIQLIACQPMSRKALITVFVKRIVALVYKYDLAFLSFVLEENWQPLKRAMLFALGHSRFWYSSWLNDYASVCWGVWVLGLVVFLCPTDGTFWRGAMMYSQVLCCFSSLWIT